MKGSQSWLEPFTWAFVTAQNKMLCQAKNAFHGPTSDGYETTRKLWEEHHRKPMTLEEAINLCRRCHRMAPFCFFNGNTFSAIARTVISKLGLDESRAFVLRSLAGHIVAGVATDEESAAFHRFCEALAQEESP